MRSTIWKKSGRIMGSPPEKDTYGTSPATSWSMTLKASSELSSSLKAFPGPDSSMQWRQARLHSLVICQATYSGAPRSSVLCSGLAAAAVVIRLLRDEAFFLELGDEGGGFGRHLAGLVVVLGLQALDERRRVRARDD